ncbi:MAG: TonB-dependent receptor [Candidatus Latescibacteria bacterium]|nr:TonB-dependent receptor [Candidatus Latescibacterota bacterium]
MKIHLLIILFILFSVLNSAGQQKTPDLELEGYQIVGKDTRVFTITGERRSTVEFSAIPLIQPGEERDIETSRGLIGEDERIRRPDIFSANHGFYSRVDVMSGSNSPLTLWGKASFDMKGKAGTIGISNRMAEENTLNNNAPFMQDVEAAGYYDVLFARFSADIFYGREDEELGSEFFRNHNRSLKRGQGGVTLRLSPFKSWDVSGRFSISGSDYEDKIVAKDESETVVVGSTDAVGEIGSTTFRLNAMGNYVEMSDLHGTISTFKGVGEWLILERLGIKAGASFSLSEAPGDNKTKARLYPQASLDWALNPGVFLKACFKPEVIRHTFAGLYAYNGLVTYDTPMLFEDRKIDISGELGLMRSSGFSGSVGAFYMTTDNMPVYTRKTITAASDTLDYYTIVSGTEVDLKGITLKGKYDNNSKWGIDGSMTFTDASGDSLENVTYTPDVKAVANGYLMFQRLWKFRCSIRYFGKHTIQWDSDVEEDEFFVVDVGVDREIFRKYLSIYFDVKNLTNNDGAWWTDQYQIPGTGMYVGLRAEY